MIGIVTYIILTINCWNAHKNRTRLDYEICNGTNGTMFRTSSNDAYLPRKLEMTHTEKRRLLLAPYNPGSCLALKSPVCVRCQNFSDYWDNETMESKCRQPIECQQFYKPPEEIPYELSPFAYQGGPCWSTGFGSRSQYLGDGLAAATFLGIGLSMLIGSGCVYVRERNRPPAPAFLQYPPNVQMVHVAAETLPPISQVYQQSTPAVIIVSNEKSGPGEAI
jgi:hypothetical protein